MFKFIALTNTRPWENCVKEKKRIVILESFFVLPLIIVCYDDQFK